MTTQSIEVDARRKPEKPSRRSQIWILALAILAAVALAALVLSLLGLIGGKARDEEPSLVVGQPTFVSESDLRAYGEAHAPIYWAGTMSDVNYELTQTMAGAVFVRYVPQNEEVGTTTEALTVATYPEQQGYTLLQEAADEANMGSQTTKTDALVVVNPNAPLSTYFSFPDAALQVEVFSPIAGESEQKVLAGDITLLGAEG